MAASNRNQHWVPQFYLRNFATPESRNTDHPKIWAFPVHKGEEFVTRTRNVAAKRDLYTLCAPKVDKALGALEDLLGRYWPILTRERYPLDLGFRRGISLFIATLYMRHPAELERQRRFVMSMAEALETGPRDDNGRTITSGISIGNETFRVDPTEVDMWRTATDQQIKAAWGDMILSESGKIAQQLIDRPWTAIVTEQPAFITTDHPVSLHNSAREDAPILHPSTTIYFPLSPTKIVLINQKKENDGRLVLISKGREAVCNYCIYQSAYRHVYSAWDSIYVLNQICQFGDWAREEHRRMAQDLLVASGIKRGRNEPCYCGSGLKFKRCCGRL